MKRLIVLIFAVIIPLLFTNCGSSKPDTGAPVDMLSAIPVWQLSKINGQQANSSAYAKGLPTASFSTDNKIKGNAGCNTYGGSYNISDEGAINISNVFSTKMYCEGSDGESAYLKALGEVNTATIEKDKVILMKGVDPVLEFTPKM